jgi:hypothetical protein
VCGFERHRPQLTGQLQVVIKSQPEEFGRLQEIGNRHVRFQRARHGTDQVAA